MVMQAQFDPFRITKFGVGFDSMLNQITSDFFTESFQGTQNFPPYNISSYDAYVFVIFIYFGLIYNIVKNKRRSLFHQINNEEKNEKITFLS